MVCLSCAMGLWLFYTNGLDFHCLFGRHVVAFIFHFFSVFFPLPLHLCFLSFSQWSSCGWNPVNVVCFSVFYSLWQTPYALRFRMLFVALFVTLSLQSLCYRSGSAIEWGLCAFIIYGCKTPSGLFCSKLNRGPVFSFCF
ncbi:hypothetical protein BDE02_12G054200 [Populus trichocarpa]|nr:hypothetical protein BDE02_12G054200 [Populus trichocarpa]